MINSSCYCFQLPNNPCCNISDNFPSESSLEVDLIWGNDIRSTRHSSISLHILWSFFHGQNLLRFLTRARQSAGIGGWNEEKENKHLYWTWGLRCPWKAEKKIWNYCFSSFKLLTKFLTTTLCHKVPIKTEEGDPPISFLSLEESSLRLYVLPEMSQFGIVMVMLSTKYNLTSLAVFYSLIFALLKKIKTNQKNNKASWRQAVSITNWEERIRNCKIYSVPFFQACDLTSTSSSHIW